MFNEPWNKEQCPHRMQVAERRLALGHLERRDAERPQVGAVVVRGVGVLVARDHLGRHPVRGADECVPSTDGPVQLG